MANTALLRIRCSNCAAEKDFQEFYRNAAKLSGRDNYCKPCRLEVNRSFRAKAVATPFTTNSDMSDAEPDDGCATPPRAADTGSTSQDALYVLRYEFDPCGVMGLKIGRAACVETRVRQLETGHNFRLIILATFPGLGHLEPCIHTMLSESRAREGRGREWFCVPLETVLHTLTLTMRE